jgi:uncharacterized membrane protein YgaE (UPF0421/DUF939 family)
MAVAATLAWVIALELLGNPTPFFAPVAAIVTLGITYGSRGRRAIELSLGVAIGILVADLLVLLLGHGTIALGIIVGISVTAAVLLGSGPIIVNQAGISAVLVVTIQPPGTGFAFERFFDALTGGAVALLVSALFLPADPLLLIRRAAVPILEELADTLEDIARALRGHSLEAAEAALLRARGIDELGSAFHDAVTVGRETARFAPVRRRSRDRVDLYAEASAQIDLAVRNVRVLARGAIRGLRLKESLPPEIADALLDLARAVRALEAVLEHPEQRDEVIGPAVRAAATATLVLERTGNLSVSVIVGQIRSTAVDLMRGAGMDYEAASDAVRHAAREAEHDLLAE